MKRIAAVALVAVATVAALPVSAPAATKVLRVTPRKANFGTKPVGSESLKSVTVTNSSSETIILEIDLIKEWDDFNTGVAGTTCTGLDQPLAPGESCEVVVRFNPSEGFEGLKQDQILRATATDPQTGEVLDSVQIVFIGRAR